MKFINWIKLKKKLIIWSLLVSICILICTIVFANLIIEISTNDKIYSDISKIPTNKVALLLGTSKKLGNGNPNRYFENRIKATLELFKANKIEFVVISGDNGRKNYNEPQDMKDILMANGIPENKIYLDYAGFRTYDSVVRINKIFGQTNFTVISQKFHNQRAIYLAENLGLNAIGYNAMDIDQYNGFKTQVREKFARVAVLFDLLVERNPKFLGDKIEIR